MQAVDYRLTDRMADPVGSEGYYVEKLIRLPLFFAYRPSEKSAPVSELPALSAGHVTFISTNVLAKIGPSVLDAWASILNRVPNSRLIILAPGGEAGNEHLIRPFSDRGIERWRLLLQPRCDLREYLDLYRKADIALDPFPFGGHTTTCDSLWMGVPSVVLAGQQYHSRMGVSVMQSLGLTDLVVHSPDQYRSEE